VLLRVAHLVDQIFDRAVELLRINTVEGGLKASSVYYNQIWARDSFISFLGANLLADEGLLGCAKANVLTFAKTASQLGQIANFYDLSNDTPEFGYSGSTDSSCWYIIGLASLFHATKDHALLRRPTEAAIDAYRWLRYQDANNAWLIDSPQGADWMDAAIQRTGKTLYNNTLFLIATRCLEDLLSTSGMTIEEKYRLDYRALKQRFTDVFLPDPGSASRMLSYWPRLGEAYGRGKLSDFSRKYFLHYVSFSRIDRRFDTLSNMLCVLTGLADIATSLSTLSTASSRRLTEPYPTRVLDPPYRGDSAGFDRTFDSSLPVQHRSIPYAYHNGAVWPFVGGVHVCALYKYDVGNAAEQLLSLAKSNSVLKSGERIGFNEWIHGKTGDALGQFGQSWNAGMFIAALMASKGRQMFSFLS
jgi:glycogen debranching enzyme